MIIIVEKLRKLVHYTKIFDNTQACKDYIERTKYLTTFLVISFEYAEIIVPQIHHFESIQSIYIYFVDKEHQQQWISDYSKVTKYISINEQLLNVLRNDVQKYLKREKERFFDDRKERDFTTENVHSWWIFFIEFLCYIPYRDRRKEFLIYFLKTHYDCAESHLKTLEEFERDYQPNNAIEWYTLDSFLYSLLNRGLRQKDIVTAYI
ncbi:unnamed protein product [Didymodactylos carnosus]|uniref:Uncharacterized protein n=1 Tax=Didymodactylos carnosus TaxID=1234261 RepID=A0A8S2T4A3_9BILA|nr:unnamed protein product [Didymodactylos carnosus]CAF4268795.1 unnamed protein product [Didymodactylos carnosus]